MPFAQIVNNPKNNYILSTPKMSMNRTPEKMEMLCEGLQSPAFYSWRRTFIYDKGCSLLKQSVFYACFQILRQDSDYLWNKWADTIEQINRSQETNYLKKYQTVKRLIHLIDLSSNFIGTYVHFFVSIKIYAKNVKGRLDLCQKCVNFRKILYPVSESW